MTRSELRALHLFSALSDEQFDRIYNASTTQTLNPQQNLFYQGESASNFYLLISGCIKLYLLSPEGEEKIVHMVQPGHFFAEAVMFLEQQHYPVNATALIQSEVMAFDIQLFRSMVVASNELALEMLSLYSRRMHFLLNELDQLALHTATQRIVYYLLENIHGHEDQVELTVSKQSIASQLSIKPETLSRTLRQLKAKNLVDVEGRMIKLLDREGLRRLLLE